MERLIAQFPRLQIAGTYSPPFRPLTAPEDREIIERINASRADIVWVGISSPTQDLWMAEHIGKIERPGDDRSGSRLRLPVRA